MMQFRDCRVNPSFGAKIWRDSDPQDGRGLVGWIAHGRLAVLKLRALVRIFAE